MWHILYVSVNCTEQNLVQMCKIKSGANQSDALRSAGHERNYTLGWTFQVQCSAGHSLDFIIGGKISDNYRSLCCWRDNSQGRTEVSSCRCGNDGRISAKGEIMTGE